MKLILASTQTYEEHKESFKEEYKCMLKRLDDGISIRYEDGIINIKTNEAEILKKSANILIIRNKTNIVEYKTNHGIIKMSIEGISVNYDYEKNEGYIKYIISMGDIKYINEILISIEEET